MHTVGPDSPSRVMTLPGRQKLSRMQRAPIHHVVGKAAARPGLPSCWRSVHGTCIAIPFLLWCAAIPFSRDRYDLHWGVDLPLGSGR